MLTFKNYERLQYIFYHLSTVLLNQNKIKKNTFGGRWGSINEKDNNETISFIEAKEMAQKR